MESLANLECFVRSAEAGGFSGAARRLGLTPAAVSRNVAHLERNLGVRLFHRSTRSLTLTETGERFLLALRDDLAGVQAAIAAVAGGDQPAGVLRVSMSLTFGADVVLPLLPEFLARYPLVRPDWRFENRQVDLVAEGYDAAIGGGFDLPVGFVARPLAPAHIVAVASPSLLEGRALPSHPAELSGWSGVVMRSDTTGRIREWTFRNPAGEEAPARLAQSVVVNDPAAVRQAARLGLGVAMLAMPDVVADLATGRLVRLAPRWWADAGAISIYYSSRAQLPAKTRAFVDHVVEQFRRERLADRFDGSLG
ncbi:LysR family transcriptional regulator [Phenylobacterium deserti]|uniref:LysR family transcriptional regulator n=1 Tax=Phenylobacterium deserti TaxID=1914756 RepID=A0A328ADH7_9CAUL|nr:LysR family transcriptional regulator [Phenylobacterium deserti]RAK52701.1 LysR family transcriptional regulator [Phenylobacterium deserti]